MQPSTAPTLAAAAAAALPAAPGRLRRPPCADPSSPVRTLGRCPRETASTSWRASWRQAAGDYGKAGSHMSVADIVDAGSLQKVRSYKKQMKAAAKAAKK